MVGDAGQAASRGDTVDTDGLARASCGRGGGGGGMGGFGGVMNNGTTSSFSMSSSTSSFPGMGGGGGTSTSTSTTTRIINGRRQSVRETIVQKPDGTVERRVETDGEPTQHLGGRRRSSQTNQLSNQLSNQQLAETAAPDRKKAKKRGSSSRA